MLVSPGNNSAQHFCIFTNEYYSGQILISQFNNHPPEGIISQSDKGTRWMAFPLSYHYTSFRVANRIKRTAPEAINFRSLSFMCLPACESVGVVDMEIIYPQEMSSAYSTNWKERISDRVYIYPSR